MTLIGQAAVIGDNRPFVSALVVIDSEVAPAGPAEGDRVHHPRGVRELPEVIEAINAEVEEAMSASTMLNVKKVKILTEEWMPDSDLLTPTSKLKRRGVNARFAAEIESIYS
ncbi:MAG: hypothetical protein R2789_04430 [Microthrixaceae bacterium]